LWLENTHMHLDIMQEACSMLPYKQQVLLARTCKPLLKALEHITKRATEIIKNSTIDRELPTFVIRDLDTDAQIEIALTKSKVVCARHMSNVYLQQSVTSEKKTKKFVYSIMQEIAKQEDVRMWSSKVTVGHNFISITIHIACKSIADEVLTIPLYAWREKICDSPR
jgi:hypothetical protein